jgi:hypothetical protein
VKAAAKFPSPECSAENEEAAKPGREGRMGSSKTRPRGTPPGILYEYQKKGVVKFAFCNVLKRKEDAKLGDGCDDGMPGERWKRYLREALWEY